MKKKRIIGVILLKNGWIVQSVGFSKFLNLGNPVTAVKRFAEWDADELIYLDISKNENYDMNREDIKQSNHSSVLDIYEDVGKVSFMPITFGGRIRSIADVDLRMERGSDKVSVKSLIVENPYEVKKIVEKYGSQCVIASIDVRKIDQDWFAVYDNGKENIQMALEKVIEECNNIQVGELFINSIDRDGSKLGFDIPLYKRACSLTSLPIIACGGAGDWDTFEEILSETNVDAVAAANVFQHIDQSMYLVRKYLHDNGFNVRPPKVLNLRGR